MTKQITRKDILNIFKTLVQTYPIQERKALNTFALITNGDIFNSKNLDKNFNDYKQGFYWSRDWVNKGASKDNIDVQYPILGIENKVVALTLAYGTDESLENSFDFSLILVDKVERKIQKARTEDMVYEDLQETMLNVLNEFRSVALFKNPADGKEYWLPRTHGEHLNYTETGFEIMDFINNQDFIINPALREYINNGIGVITTFSVKGCGVHKIDFNYNAVSVDQIAEANCSNC